ncbi:MAG TPA: hypothetical protein VI198_00065 [Candidatus Eisenbacteria bacterium]
MALGFAVALAASPGAIVVPASAAPGSADATAGVSQAPSEIEPPADPADEPWTDDEDDDESDVPPDSLGRAFPVKPSSIVPDSLRTGTGATLPVGGGAPAETLGYTPPVVGPGAAAQPPVPVRKERRTLFGIHPAAFFAALIVAHVVIVRAVTD